MSNHSEVARLMQAIDERNQAGEQGLTGLAAMAKHKDIIARLEQGAPPILALFRQGRGEDAANLLDQLVDRLTQ